MFLQLHHIFNTLSCSSFLARQRRTSACTKVLLSQPSLTALKCWVNADRQAAAQVTLSEFAVTILRIVLKQGRFNSFNIGLTKICSPPARYFSLVGATFISYASSSEQNNIHLDENFHLNAGLRFSYIPRYWYISKRKFIKLTVGTADCINK